MSSDPLTVAVVCDYALDYVGGAQTALVEQVAALRGAGCGVVVVSPVRGKGALSGGADGPFAGDVAHLRVPARWVLPGVDLPVVRNSGRVRGLLEQVFAEHRVDVVQLHSEFGMAAAAIDVARRRGLPVAHTVHTFFWQTTARPQGLIAAAVRGFHRWITGIAPTRAALAARPADSALRNMTLAVAQRADVVVSPSAHQAERLREAGLADVVVVPNTVTTTGRAGQILDADVDANADADVDAPGASADADADVAGASASADADAGIADGGVAAAVAAAPYAAAADPEAAADAAAADEAADAAAADADEAADEAAAAAAAAAEAADAAAADAAAVDEAAVRPDGATPASRPELGRPGRPLRVVWIGRCEPEKRILPFVRAVVAAQRELGPGRLHVVVVGDGSQLDDARRLASASGDGPGADDGPAGPPGIEFLGRQDHGRIPRILAGSHLAALTSYGFDNQPMTIVEAVTAGRGVLYCDPALSEGLQGPGIRIPRDEAEMATALADVVRDPGRVLAASRATRHAREEFAPETHARRMIAAYENARKR
ncbi:glycosyltransferase [Myceligenerans crystallogenes]|uniref:Glycosyltransferase subfamily 4-like N-terminal domain-containing protein n=1 Tax=Myceligenerans crystallogenes TaxID=316335 RepID=A0ABP4ZFW1_9MICO